MSLDAKSKSRVGLALSVRLIVLVGALFLSQTAVAAETSVTVYKTPT